MTSVLILQPDTTLTPVKLIHKSRTKKQENYTLRNPQVLDKTMFAFCFNIVHNFTATSVTKITHIIYGICKYFAK